MAFKMTGMNFGKGTGSALKRDIKHHYSSPHYERFAQRVAKGEVNWSDHPDYDPNYEYDKFGNPIATELRVPKTTDWESYNVSDWGSKGTIAENYEGDPNHIYNTIAFSSQSGRRMTPSTAEGGIRHPDHPDFEEHLNRAIQKYKKAEKIRGVGNVQRSHMNDKDFDLLLSYGGGEDGNTSWIQDRQVAAAKGQLDNESHIYGTDAMMYPDLKEGEAPSLRKMRKNFAGLYQGIMNDQGNSDFGTTRGSDYVNKRQSMKLARDIIPDYSLTSNPSSFRPGTFQPGSQENLTSDPVDQEEIVEEETYTEGDLNKDGKVDWKDDKIADQQARFGDDSVSLTDAKEFSPQSNTENQIDEDILTANNENVEENEERPYDEADTNQDGIVDKAERRAAMFADAYDPQSSSMSKRVDYNKPNPYQYGTPMYYQWKKDKISDRLGFKKRIYNIWQEK